MNENPLIMIAGRSACGKSTLVERACKDMSLQAIPSYTTRKARYDGEQGHTFVTDEEYDLLENRVAENSFCSNRYCVTAEQIDNPAYTFYVVDCEGIRSFNRNYAGKRPVYTVQIGCDERIRVERLKHRYSKICQNEVEMLNKVLDRVVADNKEFGELDDLTTYYIDNSFDEESSYAKFKELVTRIMKGDNKDV